MAAEREASKERERLLALSARREMTRSQLAARRTKREAADVRPRSGGRTGSGGDASLRRRQRSAPPARTAPAASAVPASPPSPPVAMGSMNFRPGRPASAPQPPSPRSARAAARPTSALEGVLRTIGDEYASGLRTNYALAASGSVARPPEGRLSSILSKSRGHPGHSNAWNACAEPKSWEFWHRHERGSFGRALLQLPKGSEKREQLKVPSFTRADLRPGFVHSLPTSSSIIGRVESRVLHYP